MAAESHPGHLIPIHNAFREGVYLKKGEETKQEILTVAERLFCQNGFDATSVNDILSVIHGSKGGFYHHFPSKDAVLQTICQNKADLKAQRTRDMLGRMRRDDVVRRINFIFQSASPLCMEDADFLAMLLPLLGRTDGLGVRVTYQEALQKAFSPILTEEIYHGTDLGVLYPACTDLAYPLLNLYSSCWMEVCLLLVAALEEKHIVEASQVQSVLVRYRKVVEHLLDAPYGSILLVNLDTWEDLAERLTRPKGY
ncbi:MAG: TetR/AcrR family transcriptional regulator [Clostridia bacterium]|nr:TetR/AcrR family transcriptional regulator [Clostridia bacterium]